MNFKEQMQKSAEIEYPDVRSGWMDQQTIEMFRKMYCKGFEAALSSDLVKGLVDAGDKILEWFKQDDETGVLNADDVMDALRVVLTNYKQEVKQ